MMATLTGTVFNAQPGMKLWKHFLPEAVLPLAATQDLPGGYAGKDLIGVLLCFLAASKCSLEFHHTLACVVLGRDRSLP